jgi:SMODS domain-containing protein
MSGSGSWSSPRDNALTLRDVEARKSEAAYNAEVTSIMDDALRSYNNRDVETINKHLNVLEKALSKDIEEFVEMNFGGSIAKHSYVDGLSDIDILVNVADTKFANHDPQHLLSYFSQLIQERLPKTTVSVGDMAITIKYSDGCEVQLLPAIKNQTGIRIAKADGNGWSNVVRPQKFAEKLTEINKSCSGRVIPIIKLFKGAQSSFPKDQCLSGYHIESLAVNAFRDYKGSLGKKEMFRHFCDYVGKNVTKPVADSTGQSVHVDDRLGQANSTVRRQIAATVTRMVSRLDAGDARHDAGKWGDVLNGE